MKVIISLPPGVNYRNIPEADYANLIYGPGPNGMVTVVKNRSGPIGDYDPASNAFLKLLQSAKKK